MTKITLFLSNLPEEATETAILALLSPHAKLDKVKLKMIQSGASCAGYGFAELQNSQEASLLISLSEKIAVQGATMAIRLN